MSLDWKSEWKPFLLLVGGFLACWWLPVDSPRFRGAVLESLALVRWYAREHVLLCLVPAFFIAGAVAVFVRREAVMRYLGPRASRPLAYGVASVSGTILAVCSCTVLPLFAGIYRMGAGLGPATAFLYSGPAINVLAIVLTARVLGMRLGVARAVGAIAFSVLVGLAMEALFREDEGERIEAALAEPPPPPPSRPLWQNGLLFAALVAILVCANLARPDHPGGAWFLAWRWKWPLVAGAAAALAGMLVAWFRLPWWKVVLAAAPAVLLAVLLPGRPVVAFGAGAAGLSFLLAPAGGEAGDWFAESWGFARQILPLLFAGVLVAGLLLGRPGHGGLVPASWVASAVGGNGFGANFFASVAGAFMYFATLTEVPILEGLLHNGMGQGPALALLLAGPALSLPNMLVIRRVLGTRKTVAYVSLVVVMATLSGLLYGALFAGAPSFHGVSR